MEESSKDSLNKSVTKKGFLRDRIAKAREVVDNELGDNEQENTDQQPNELSILVAEDLSGLLLRI